MTTEEKVLTEFKGHKFKIKAGAVAGVGKTKVTMDGKPLKGVKLLNLNMVLGKINTILLEFIPAEVEVDIDAIVKAIQPENPGTELVNVTTLNGDGTMQYIRNPKLHPKQ